MFTCLYRNDLGRRITPRWKIARLKHGVTTFAVLNIRCDCSSFLITLHVELATFSGKLHYWNPGTPLQLDPCLFTVSLRIRWWGRNLLPILKLRKVLLSRLHSHGHGCITWQAERTDIPLWGFISLTKNYKRGRHHRLIRPLIDECIIMHLLMTKCKSMVWLQQSAEQ